MGWCCSLPGQDSLQSDSTWQSLPPHFGTRAAVKAIQQVLGAADNNLQKLTGSQGVSLTSLGPVRQTGWHLA